MVKIRSITDTEKLENIKTRIEIRKSVAEQSLEELVESGSKERWVIESIKEREYLLRNLEEILKDFCDI